MQTAWQVLEGVLVKNGLLTAFTFVGATMLAAYWASEKLTRGRVHGSAIAILIGLACAAFAGTKNGVADIRLLSGVGLMGGAMLRDLSIVATAFGVRRDEFVKGGVMGVVSLFTGLATSFISGGAVAFAFGYRDAVSITTIGAGAATYIVGPVTGTALGASSEVIALSVAAGLVKAISVMIATPFLAQAIGLNSPRAAMIFGGLMGTNSGVMAGLAATDPKLVPYGAMTATFYTGLGCLLGPSVFFIIVRNII
ncbi:MAG: malonate transporter subunit MadM [Planctomycetaceae bacterium]